MIRVRTESGFVMITALLTLFVITGLGIALLTLTDQQQSASSKEQSSEIAFNVAEGALNAQTGQLARDWPAEKPPEGEQPYPPVCTSSTSTSTNGCPTAESLAKGYPVSGSTCTKGGSEAWGSALTNQWTTYVRDDGELGKPPNTVYNATEVKNSPTYDANGDGKVWVRSVGVSQCRTVTLISLVSEQLLSVPFPESAVAGNWFSTGNKGNKVILNTEGKEATAGGISMRCEGRTKENCEEYREGQVKPNTTGAPPTPNPAIPVAQRESLKATAKVLGRYFEKGNCPKSFSQLAGEPTYVEGPCELSFKGNEVVNTEEKPGFLVIQDGTLTLDGGDEYNGTVYAVNEQKSAGVVVWLKGKSRVRGSIVVDGSGGIQFGDSGGKGHEENENYIYSDKAVLKLTAFIGAAGTRNSFRVLPTGQ
jgi:Tfp pilus assembly protein PilX